MPLQPEINRFSLWAGTFPGPGGIEAGAANNQSAIVPFRGRIVGVAWSCSLALDNLTLGTIDVNGTTTTADVQFLNGLNRGFAYINEELEVAPGDVLDLTSDGATSQGGSTVLTWVLERT